MRYPKLPNLETALATIIDKALDELLSPAATEPLDIIDRCACPDQPNSR